jgi:hypothetical protein
MFLYVIIYEFSSQDSKQSLTANNIPLWYKSIEWKTKYDTRSENEIKD